MVYLYKYKYKPWYKQIMEVHIIIYNTTSYGGFTVW